MASGYPASFDTLATVFTDDTNSQTGADEGTSTTVGFHATQHNDTADAVNKIQRELGIQPRGLYASTVRERFEIAAFKNQSCKFATTATLAATYANGTAGVGATLTASPGVVAPTTDGITWVVGDRVLVKNQTTAAQNGVYTVTQITSPWILTRAIDADTSIKIADCVIIVDQGTFNGDTQWACVTTAPTMGTTAIYWRRTMPFYGHGNPRNPWAPNAPTTQVAFETMPRQFAEGIYTHPITGALQTLVGGAVVGAGKTVTNINFFVYAVGAAPTVSWFALARQSDRVTMGHTTNIVTAPAAANAITTRALATPYTAIEDTPVWIVMSYVNATTAMTLAGGAIPATPATVAPFRLQAPAMYGTNAVTPTTTDGTTVIAAATVGSQLSMPYFWLT
jgi:hypothetical protein